jgi:hypothetical protein
MGSEALAAKVGIFKGTKAESTVNKIIECLRRSGTPGALFNNTAVALPLLGGYDGRVVLSPKGRSPRGEI